MKVKTQLTNRILGLVLGIMMVISMLPTNVFTASAEAEESNRVIYCDIGPWTSLTGLKLKYSSDNSTINEIVMEKVSDNIWKADLTTNDLTGQTIQFVGENVMSVGTVVPADKNCFRITEYNDTTMGYEGVWYQYPCASHDYKDGICACGVACTHTGGTATCTEKAVCTVCGASYGEMGGHTLTYTANGNIITEFCSANCGYSETAAIIARDATYDGLVHNTAIVDYSEGWKGGELTISYANNTNAGTATASITVGEATASVEFTIAKAPLTVTADAKIKSYGDEDPPLTYTAEGLLGGDTLTGALTGALSRAEGENMGEYDITLGTLSADNYTISFVGADLTIQAKEVTDPIVTLDQTSYQHDGNVKEPKVISIVVDGRTLTEGRDYTVSYEDNVYVGEKAAVVINFMGNYDGTFRKWFTITQDPNTTEFDGEWVTVPKG